MADEVKDKVFEVTGAVVVSFSKVPIVADTPEAAASNLSEMLHEVFGEEVNPAMGDTERFQLNVLIGEVEEAGNAEGEGVESGQP